MPRNVGSSNFTREQVYALLEIIVEVKPIGAEMWRNVAHRYAALAVRKGWAERDADSLKAKYMQLLRNKKPTGDPTCPTPVKRAKRIAREIEGSVAMSTLGVPREADTDEEVSETQSNPQSTPIQPSIAHEELTDMDEQPETGSEERMTAAVPNTTSQDSSTTASTLMSTASSSSTSYTSHNRSKGKRKLTSVGHGGSVEEVLAQVSRSLEHGGGTAHVTQRDFDGFCSEMRTWAQGISTSIQSLQQSMHMLQTMIMMPQNTAMHHAYSQNNGYPQNNSYSQNDA